MMKSILSFLNSCEFGKKQTCRNLTLFPVLHANAVESYYLTLEQAIASGFLTVTEIDDAGNVNRLKLTNEGSKPILLIEGGKDLAREPADPEAHRRRDRNQLQGGRPE